MLNKTKRFFILIFDIMMKIKLKLTKKLFISFKFYFNCSRLYLFYCLYAFLYKILFNDEQIYKTFTQTYHLLL